jgi:hypothetical protein
MRPSESPRMTMYGWRSGFRNRNLNRRLSLRFSRTPARRSKIAGLALEHGHGERARASIKVLVELANAPKSVSF